jgi:hypothetical protein
MVRVGPQRQKKIGKLDKVPKHLCPSLNEMATVVDSNNKA